MLAVIAVTGVVITTYSKSPSHDRNWKTEYEVLPTAKVDGETLIVQNLRNFTYRSDGTIADAAYEDRVYDLRDLKELWYGISHFYPYGLAHTFLSFGFGGDEFLTVSIEARQEKGESYHPATGLLRNYELMFVLADERDVIGVRTHIRKERVYLYRIDATLEKVRRMLDIMLGRVNDIKTQPEFYNTLTDNCTTSILKHAERLSWADIYLDYRVLLPGYSDEVAYELGILSTDVPLSELRVRSRLDPARTSINDQSFSWKIRGN